RKVPGSSSHSMAIVLSVCIIGMMRSKRSVSRRSNSLSPSAPGSRQDPVYQQTRLSTCVFGFAEVDIRERVKQAGGKWNPHRKVWELRYAQVVALQLETRIVDHEASTYRCQK